ncbi:MAG: hypothetical protein WBF84_05035 [Castellaniella sp.]|uniref:hypothetical protein n=1 Tax=Castellaniella sp. TaxID=1955812 RepID=UPI003C7168B6
MLNNEAGLQAHFVKHLASVFTARVQDVDRRIFVEPPFKILNEDKEVELYIPDIVICSARKIIGIVELKYAPRGKPKFKPDIRKLCHFFAHRKEDIELRDERYLGPTKPSTFRFSRDLLLVYAAVYDGALDGWKNGVRKYMAEVEGEGAEKSLFVLGAGTKADAQACCWSMAARDRNPSSVSTQSFLGEASHERD